MNIFVLDLDPERAARYHCDKHVGKMAVEAAQMLSSAWHIHVGRAPSGYALGYVHHPCSRWAARRRANYFWLHRLATALTEQHELRFGREPSATVDALDALRQPPETLRGAFRPSAFYPAVSDDLRDLPPVEAYRLFYARDKRRFAHWRLGAPHWWPDACRTIDEIDNAEEATT